MKKILLPFLLLITSISHCQISINRTVTDELKKANNLVAKLHLKKIKTKKSEKETLFQKKVYATKIVKRKPKVYI